MLQRMTRNDPADQYPERVDAPSDEYVVKARKTAARLAVLSGASPAELREVLEALGLIAPAAPAPPQKPMKPVALPDPPKPAVKPSTAVSAPAKRARKARPARDTSLCGKRRHAMTGNNVRIRADGRRRCRACSNDWAAGKQTPAIPRPKPEPIDPGPRTCRSGAHLLPDGGECKDCANERAKRYRVKKRTLGGISAVKKAARVEAAERRRQASIDYARQVLAAVPKAEVPPVDDNGAPLLRCSKRLHYKSGKNLGSATQGSTRVGRCLACDRIRNAKETLRRFGEAES